MALIPAVAYLRMSTDAQTESVPAQRAAVKEYAKSHGYRIIREYVDLGISGDETSKRLEFQRMLADASKRDFQVVLCWNQDRFGRFDLLEAGFWIKPLRDAGVSLVTVSQGKIDWNDFAGRLIYSIEQEGKNKFLRDLSWNVNRGQYARAVAGLWGGPAPFGYRLQPDGKLRIEETEADTVRLVFQLITDGLSRTACCKELKRLNRQTAGGGTRWTHGLISRMVANLAYKGTLRRNRTTRARYSQNIAGTIVSKNSDGRERPNDPSAWLTVENAVPPIVTAAEFEAANNALKTGGTWRGGRPARSPIIFRGILFCGFCGSSMRGAFANTMGDVVYTCNEHTAHGSCNPNRVYQSALLDRVRKTIESGFLKPSTIAAVRREALAKLNEETKVQTASIGSLNKQLAAVQTKLKKLESRLTEVPSDMVTIVSNQIRELREQQEAIETQLAEAERPKEETTANLLLHLDHVVEELRSCLTIDETRLNVVLTGCVDRISATTVFDPSRGARGKYTLKSVEITPKTL